MMSSTLRSISNIDAIGRRRTVAERGYRLMQVISPNRSPGPSSATDGRTADPPARRSESSGGRSRPRGDPACARQPAGELAEESGLAAAGLHVRHRRRKKNLRLAFDDVERGRAVFAFAADDVALLEMAAHHRVLVQLEKSAGDFLEIGEAASALPRRPVRRAGAPSGPRCDWSARRWDRKPCTRRTKRRTNCPSARSDRTRFRRRSPCPCAPSTLLLRISSQPRMQRSQRMQAS